MSDPRHPAHRKWKASPQIANYVPVRDDPQNPGYKAYWDNYAKRNGGGSKQGASQADGALTRLSELNPKTNDMKRYMGRRVNPGNVNERKDLRPINSPATQAGMRGVHRGMGGEVIGGYTAEGQAVGTKAGKPAYRSRLAERNQIGVQPSSLGGGLARWNQMNPGGMGPKATAKREQDGRMAAASRGAFGQKAQGLAAAPQMGAAGPALPPGAPGSQQNLAKRRKLYERMKSAGVAGITTEMENEAKDLGVKHEGWRSAMRRLGA